MIEYIDIFRGINRVGYIDCVDKNLDQLVSSIIKVKNRIDNKKLKKEMVGAMEITKRLKLLNYELNERMYWLKKNNKIDYFLENLNYKSKEKEDIDSIIKSLNNEINEVR